MIIAARIFGFFPDSMALRGTAVALRYNEQVGSSISVPARVRKATRPHIGIGGFR